MSRSCETFQPSAGDKSNAILPSFESLLSHTQPFSTLRQIPHVDIDTSDFHQVILWEELKGKSFEEWLHLYNHRSDRMAYGTTSSERKSTRVTGCVEEDDNPVPRSSSTKEHRIKEHERRVRHAIWQNQTDLLTGDFCYELATRNLHDFKVHLGHRTLAHASSGDKEPGKDQQLFAGVFSALMGRWINNFCLKSLLAGEFDIQSSPSMHSMRRSSSTFSSKPWSSRLTKSRISKSGWSSGRESSSPRPSSPRKLGGQRYSRRFANNVSLCRL